MTSKEIFILSIIAAVGLILFSLVTDKKTFLIKIFFRGVAGVFIIYLVNAIFLSIEIPLKLGVNFYTICTTAFLGVPGLTLLYGVLGCKIL